MKRTFRSRFVGSGNVDETRAVVDKLPTYGRTYRDPDVIARELAGVGETIECEACDVTLQATSESRSRAWRRHCATKKHQRATEAREGDPR